MIIITIVLTLYDTHDIYIYIYDHIIVYIYIYDYYIYYIYDHLLKIIRATRIYICTFVVKIFSRLITSEKFNRYSVITTI